MTGPACERRPVDSRCHLCGKGPLSGTPWYCEVGRGDESTVGVDPTTTAPERSNPGVLGTKAPVVPGFEVQGVLGSGGMGTVYLADSEAHGTVALKILHDAAPDSGLARRFRREAEGLASLNLPGVVEVYDSGFEGDLHWLAMKWVQGPTLERVLGSSGKLPEAEALRIAIAVARTLGKVHAAGMVHRDIKPSNLLLDTNGTPVLADFGILRHLDDDSHTALTQRPIGTPAYMAPEIMKSGDVDWVRADVYALAVLLARCLLGRVPQGNWDLDEIAADIRPVIGRAMSSRAELRFPTPDAFADALESPPTAAKQSPLRAAAIVGLVCGIAVLAVVAVDALQPDPVDASMDFSPVAELLRSGRFEEAERVFALQLDQADPATADGLWLKRAAALGRPEAWGEAWDQVSDAARPKALEGLSSALLANHDYGALDMLLAQGGRETLDPTGEISAEVDLFHGRFDAARDALPEGFHPLVDALRQATPAPYDEQLPTSLGWWCDGEQCTNGDGERYRPSEGFLTMQGTSVNLAWGPDWVEPIGGGKRCALPDLGTKLHGAAWNGQAALVNTGFAPMVHLLDMDSCALVKHPDHAAWEDSYVTMLLPWDADADGVEELAVMVGEAFGYELRLYDTDHQLVDSLLLGSVRSAARIDGDLVVAMGEPHANGKLFDLAPPGVHRITFAEEALKVTQSWPGNWGHVSAGDPFGTGRDVLLMTEIGVQSAFVVPGVEGTARVGPIHFGEFSHFDVHGGERLSVKTPAGSFVTGTVGTESFAVPRPEALTPTGDAEIDRARALEGVGMRSLAARNLSLRALSRTGDAARAAWVEAGRLHEESGESEAAIRAWTEAAYRGHPGAWDRVVAWSIREGDLAGAAAVIDALPPGSEVDDRWLAASRSFRTHDFDQRPREWATRSPFASWDADRSLIRIRSAGPAGAIARRPLRERGEVRGFQVDLSLDRLEFGSDLRFRLVGEEGTVAELVVFSGGSRGGLFRSLSPDPYRHYKVDDSDPTGPHRVTVTLALDGLEGVFTSVEGDRVERHRFEASEAGALVALQIDAIGMSGALSDVSLRRVSTWGMDVAKPQSLGRTSSEVLESAALTTLRTSPAVSAVQSTDTQLLRRMELAYVVPWRMHRGASRLQDRLVAIPGLDDESVWAASPELALVRAEILLSKGDAAGAVEILRAIEVPRECVRQRSMIWAAELALEEDERARAARVELDACGASETRVQTELWWLGLIAENGAP